MPGFQITLINPTDSPHIEGLREIVEGLEYSLQALGHDVRIATNRFSAERTNILMGAHLLTPELAVRIPRGSVIYNLEQLGGAKLTNYFLAAACMHQIWDYSPLNIDLWKTLPCRWEPRLLEIGFVPELARIAKAPVQDIGVLFYGSPNERRAEILNRLYEARVPVRYACSVYGKERDELISRAQIVLNLHHYDTQVFETARVSYLLNNGKAVVSETSRDIGRFAAAILACSTEELVPQIAALLSDESRRQALECRGAEVFAERPQAALLAEVLRYAPQPRNITPTQIAPQEPALAGG